MSNDRDLGLHRPINRRDFVGGVAATAAAGLALPARAAGGRVGAQSLGPDYYPPALMGMRGNHPGSFESAHAVRDAKGWARIRRSAVETHEDYDLVVVGGGISGLAAAYFYRQQHGNDARILILDNHDDFGGHAKRNEFTHNGRVYIGYGGTEQIYFGPWDYSPVALDLIKAIGVDTDRFYTAFDWTRYARMRLTEGVFFDRETFGRDHLAVGEKQVPWQDFLAGAPLSEKAKNDIIRLYQGNIDYLPQLTIPEKQRLLDGMTYNDFLMKVAKVDPMVIPYLRSRTDRDVMPTDYMPIWWAGLYYDMPGLDGMCLPRPKRRLKRDPEEIFHFPDGNAGVARLLVRALIPSALKARDMEDQVTARLDYARLDQDSSPIRLRLASTAVDVRHQGDAASARHVDVTYLNAGNAYRVRGRHVVLACNNSMIPFLCPDMPETQKIALGHAIRSPLVYTNVLISNWRAWNKLGVHYIHALSGYHTEVKLDFPVDVGTYRSSASPDDPIVLHLEKRFWDDGPRAWERTTRSLASERARFGRAQLLGTSFETIERDIRESLGRMLGPGGFDPAADVLAITVNRWPHGYSVGRDPLMEPEFPKGSEPWTVGAQPFGRITVANSDAAGDSVTQAAIDEAHRAVGELRS